MLPSPPNLFAWISHTRKRLSLIENRRFWPWYSAALLLALLLTFLVSNYAILRDEFFTQPPFSTPLTVVIPLSPKDMVTLPYAVTSVKRYLQNPIANILVVAPRTPEILRLCESLQVEFFDENRVYDREKFLRLAETLGATTIHMGRPTTWYYQQLLKLYFAMVSPTEDYFVMDADVVFQRSITMRQADGAYRFLRLHVPRHWPHQIHLCAVNRLLGGNFSPGYTYIAELMIFNRKIVAQMIKHVEKEMQMKFEEAILVVSKDSDTCRFSEYETYGYYVNDTLSPDRVKNRLLLRGNRHHKEMVRDAYRPWLHLYQFILYGNFLEH